MGGLIEREIEEGKDERKRRRDVLEELPLYCDSCPLQITTKPLEHLRSGCCMARVPLQHDLISCLGLDAGVGQSATS